jgi:MinD superfamily P-loop ATPase
MIISVASGKGGTGKTTVATNLALSIGTNVQLLDCDVEQPNAHLFLHPVWDRNETVTTPVPKINLDKCTLCGKCRDLCEFNAITVIAETVMVFEELCHSCGGCMAVCPENAITEKGRELGVLQKGHLNGIEFIHGKLRVGEAMSPPLIKEVLSYGDPARLTIVDAPPGTSCPVIETMKPADLHLITNPRIIRRNDFQAGNTAVINNDLCTECGLCREMCRWDAIGDSYEVNSIGCEGCGVCVHFCPETAIEFPENTCGEWFVSDTRCGPMVHARLGIAEENSGKLVTLVRQEARKLANDRSIGLILTDGPPGVGCPVIASIGGASAVLIVTEPTVSGKHDMKRVVQLAAHFNIPALVCVNKFDLNLELTREIETYAEEKGIVCLGRIPFDQIFIKAMIQAQTILEYNTDSKAGQATKEIWQRLSTELCLS